MDVLVKDSKKKMSVVDQIHHDVDTAQDRLIAEAMKIMSDNALPENALTKAERLEKLGFVKSVDVIDARSTQNAQNMGRIQAEIITKHKENYPDLKFLTEFEFDRICKKYGLIYAPVKHYLKSVPFSNLKEIEEAKPLGKSDMPRPKYLMKFDNDDFNGLTKKERKLVCHRGIAVSSTQSSLIDVELSRHFNKTVHYKGWSSDVNYSNIINNGLFIAAPTAHFDLEDLTNVELGFFEIFKPEPKDPIVFRYCNGGIQVLTKWGEEANDPDLK